MIGRAFVLIGYFMIGVSIVGLFSLSAYAFPAMRAYGFWLSVVAGLIVILLASCDDYFSDALEMSQLQYVALLVSIVLILLIGGTSQWIR